MVVLVVTESRPKPCFTIAAVTETKNVASFGAVTETETEFRSASTQDVRPEISKITKKSVGNDGNTCSYYYYTFNRGQLAGQPAGD